MLTGLTRLFSECLQRNAHLSEKSLFKLVKEEVKKSKEKDANHEVGVDFLGALFGAFLEQLPGHFAPTFCCSFEGRCALVSGKRGWKTCQKSKQKKEEKNRKTQGKKRSPAGSRGFLGLSFLALFSSSFLLFFIDFSFSWNCVPHTAAGGKVAEKRAKKVRRKMMKNVKNSSAI